LKQDPGTYLREKLSHRGFWTKTRGLGAKTGWASNLKFGKLRGVHARNRAKLQLLLN
jgi:hypothetical protein